jgi:hypothetical protein
MNLQAHRLAFRMNAHGSPPSERSLANNLKAEGAMGLTSTLQHTTRILGLDQQEVASILGVSMTQLNAGAPLPMPARDRMEKLIGLARRLEDTFEHDSIQIWLHTPNRDLHLRIPSDRLRAGELDEIEGALEALDSGVYV